MEPEVAMRWRIIWLDRLLCHHHYLLRYDVAERRLWLECSKCLKTTPGWSGVRA